ncbi:Cyclin-dependent kinase inhibitor 3 [Bos mutus]|uniref:protein-tyrosine-phosphatase n=1 Tax=Bos mutus TaxID=72004 RepID=L8I9M4_9CETA|nr:Cyclin-dependent kinase inhibitor 3 [Bos mutus]
MSPREEGLAAKYQEKVQNSSLHREGIVSRSGVLTRLQFLLVKLLKKGPRVPNNAKEETTTGTYPKNGCPPRIMSGAKRNAILIKTNKQNNEIVKNATDEINRMLCQRITETVTPLEPHLPRPPRLRSGHCFRQLDNVFIENQFSPLSPGARGALSFQAATSIAAVENDTSSPLPGDLAAQCDRIINILALLALLLKPVLVTDTAFFAALSASSPLPIVAHLQGAGLLKDTRTLPHDIYRLRLNTTGKSDFDFPKQLLRDYSSFTNLAAGHYHSPFIDTAHTLLIGRKAQGTEQSFVGRHCFTQEVSLAKDKAHIGVHGPSLIISPPAALAENGVIIQQAAPGFPSGRRPSPGFHSLAFQWRLAPQPASRGRDLAPVGSPAQVKAIWEAETCHVTASLPNKGQEHKSKCESATMEDSPLYASNRREERALPANQRSARLSSRASFKGLLRTNERLEAKPGRPGADSMQTSEFDSSDEEPVEDEQTPIQISWLPLSRVNCSQFLGLCALPGCKFKDVRRNIQKDTEELKSYGIQDIFVFCTRGELSKYRVPNLLDLYHQYGIITHHHPIPDGGTPDITSCCEIMEELEICLKNNRKTLIQTHIHSSVCVYTTVTDGLDELSAPKWNQYTLLEKSGSV